MPFDMHPMIDHSYEVEKVVQQCIVAASNHYNVPTLLVKAIRNKEAGTIGKVTLNKKKTHSYDIGPMQVNNLWINELAKLNITEHQLTNDPCTNVYVGTWILKKYYNHHEDWFKATQSYNAGYKIENGRKYAFSVFDKWKTYYKSSLLAAN